MQKEIFLNLKVVTNSKEFKIVAFEPQTSTIKVKVKAKPQKGLANKELEQKLGKFFSGKAKIVFGKNSKNKKISVQCENALDKLKNL